MIRRPSSRHALFLLFPLLGASLAAAQATPRPQPYALQNVSLDRSVPDAAGSTVILQDGRVEAIQEAAAPLPPGVRRIDGKGLLCLPAFLDAYTNTGVATPEPVKDQDVPVDVLSDVRIDMRAANRKGIEPAFHASEALAIDADAAEAWQAAGFGTAVVAPKGQLLAGTSGAVATREAAMRDLVVRPELFEHAAFDATGPSYPSTLMGYHAQLRQFFMDAQRHRELVRRYADGRPGLRPPFDEELEAGTALLDGKLRLVCQADSARDIERWIRLADEFGISIAISGGGEAWKVAQLLADRRIPVFLTLDWGEEVEDPTPEAKEPTPEAKETAKPGENEEAPPEAEPETAPEETAEETAPAAEEAAPQEAAEPQEEAEEASEADDDEAWSYLEPLGVREERRRLWEEKRDNALRLHEAGVRFVFGTGARSPKELLGAVRTLVEVGLPAEVAQAALTRDAADLLGLTGLGRVEPGALATLALWTADPLTEKDAKVAWSVVDGFPREFEIEDEGPSGPPAEGVDVSGKWLVETESQGQTRTADLELTMDPDGKVTGTVRMENPRDGSEMEAEVTGQVSGKEVRFSWTFRMGDMDVQVKNTGKIEGDSISGKSSTKLPFSDEPRRSSFTASRVPKGGRS